MNAERPSEEGASESAARVDSRRASDRLIEAINLQNINGSWEHGAAILGVIQMSDDDFSNELSRYSESARRVVSGDTTQRDLVTTICVLAWLRLRHRDRHATWQLIEQKAVAWLLKMGVSEIESGALSQSSSVSRE